MNTNSIALEQEQIDELLELLEMGENTKGIFSQLQAHSRGDIKKINEEIATSIYMSLGEIFDSLQSQSNAIKMSLPLVIEKMRRDLGPAQKKARELVNRFNELGNLPRGKVRGDAQLAFHRVISAEMTDELNKVADRWGVERVQLSWCDHEIMVLSKEVPIHNIFFSVLGDEFARLINPTRYWELFNKRLDQIDLRIRINTHRDILKSLFDIKTMSNLILINTKKKDEDGN